MTMFVPKFIDVEPELLELF